MFKLLARMLDTAALWASLTNQTGDLSKEKVTLHPRQGKSNLRGNKRKGYYGFKPNDFYITLFNIPDPNFFHPGSEICIKEFK